MQKVLLFVTVFSVSCFECMAQQGSGGGQPWTAKSPIGHIYGKVLDAKTKENIPYASVAIFKKDSVVNGCLTKDNGDFSLEKLPFGKFNLKITALGFKTYEQSVNITPQNAEQDIGNIKIEAQSSVLKEAEVEGEKSASEISIDRRVFNVDKNISTKGGTAMDVMKNVPSVTIDAGGNVLLRQNVATIYVDGKPTLLTLDQIPADQTDRVEVITNPSAKYDAGATGGIINVVMKSNTKPGYNGMVNGGIGTNNHYNGMALFNFRQKPFGFSISYNVSSFNNPVTGYNNRTDLTDGNPTGYYNSNSNTQFQNTFQNGNVAFDYYLNNRNTLTVSESMTIGDFNTNNDQYFKIGNTMASVDTTGQRLNPAVTHFQLYSTDLKYKKTFPKKGRELTADIRYTDLSAHTDNPFTTSVYNASGILQTEYPYIQNNNGYTTSNMFMGQIDYVDPLNDSAKLEMGLRSNDRPSIQSYDVTELNYGSSQYYQNNLLTNSYTITNLVNAAYVNYTSKIWGLNYAVGLRVENTWYKGVLTNKGDSSFQILYPSGWDDLMKALFPSLFITKKFNEKQELQFNITRKINRPNYQQYLPFIQSSDFKDYTIGNPAITPEFVTMAEVNFNQTLAKGNLFFGLFYRNSQDPLTSVTVPLSRLDSTFLVTTSINGKQSNTIGMDNTFKYTLFKGFEATLNMNLFYTIIDATYENINLNNQGFYYNGKINFVEHLPQNFNLQLSGNYESPKIIPQGTTQAVYFADCGLSKEIHKFITITASVSDIFNTKGYGTILTTDQFNQQTWSRRESRYFKITLMVRFGRADASLFRKRPKPEDSDSFF